MLPSTADAGRGDVGLTAHLAALEQEIGRLRRRRREAINERDQLRHVSSGASRPPPHAHLRHRAVPDTATTPGVLVRFWSGASLSILLILLGLALLLNLGPVLWVTVGAVLIVMAVEALLHGRLLLFLLGLINLAAVGLLIWLFITHLRIALGVLALVAAAAIGIANLRNLLARR